MADGDPRAPEEMLAAEIGQRVFHARVRPRPGFRKGYTQIALAERSGVAQARISEIESGNFDARTLVAIRALAIALGLDPCELLFPRVSDTPPHIPVDEDPPEAVPIPPAKRPGKQKPA